MTGQGTRKRPERGGRGHEKGMERERGRDERGTNKQKGRMRQRKRKRRITIRRVCDVSGLYFVTRNPPITHLEDNLLYR